jgi:hypothetical protein
MDIKVITLMLILVGLQILRELLGIYRDEKDSDDSNDSDDA